MNLTIVGALTEAQRDAMRLHYEPERKKDNGDSSDSVVMEHDGPIAEIERPQ